MRPPATHYIATQTLALPTQGIAYLAIAQVGMGPSHRRHQHAEVQVLWMLAGSMGMEFETGEPISMDVGTGCVIPSRLAHAVTRPRRPSNDQARVVDLRISDDQANPFRRFLADLGTTVTRFDAPAVGVERATHRLQTAIANTGLARQAGILSAIWELLATLAPVSGEGWVSTVLTNRDPRITQAEDFCRHGLSSPLTVDDIAGAVGLSRSQLSRLFYDAYQLGPAERLRQMRIELARHLLSATTLSIKEVAHACGFTRANHFGRVFKEITGTTPGAFRSGTGRSSE